MKVLLPNVLVMDKLLRLQAIWKASPSVTFLIHLYLRCSVNSWSWALNEGNCITSNRKWQIIQKTFSFGFEIYIGAYLWMWGYLKFQKCISNQIREPNWEDSMPLVLGGDVQFLLLPTPINSTLQLTSSCGKACRTLRLTDISFSASPVLRQGRS